MYMYVMMHCVSRLVFDVCRPLGIQQQHSREREREKERLLTTHVLLYSVVLHVVSYKDGCDIWIIQVYIVGRVAHSV